jgi:hypothetical protein
MFHHFGRRCCPALGIATVYCFTAFSFTLVGGALACGIRSPADASAGIDALKKAGPVSSDYAVLG